MTTPITTEQEDFSFRDIWRSVRRRKFWTVSITVAAIIGALAYVSSAQPEWEATGVIQIGKVGQLEDVGKGGAAKGDGAPIEAVARTLERMKQNSFGIEVLKVAEPDFNINDAENGLYMKSRQIKLLGTSDLLELKVRGHSREQAAKWIDATVSHLGKIHETLASPARQRLIVALEEATRDLKQAKAEQKLLSDNLPSKQKNNSGNQFSENVLFAGMVTVIDQRVSDLQARKLALEEQTSPANSYQTSLLDRVYVSTRHVFPKRSLIVLIAGIFGLMIGVFVALVVDYFSNQKQ
ncbi:MAG: Wzz/FepE/Etk N-terminal domain-containing protein [Pseudomonadota bacterium]